MNTFDNECNSPDINYNECADRPKKQHPSEELTLDERRRIFHTIFNSKDRNNTIWEWKSELKQIWDLIGEDKFTDYSQEMFIQGAKFNLNNNFFMALAEMTEGSNSLDIYIDPNDKEKLAYTYARCVKDIEYAEREIDKNEEANKRSDGYGSDEGNLEISQCQGRLMYLEDLKKQLRQELEKIGLSDMSDDPHEIAKKFPEF